MNPVSINDLGQFFSNVLSSYDAYLYFALTFMFAAHALVLARRLLVGVRQ